MATAPTQKQIREKYGAPDDSENRGTKEYWRYFDPSTKTERMKFIFNDSKALIQIVWFPLPGETELEIERIFERYPAGYFSVSNKSKISDQSLQTETTYSGESVAIFRDDTAKRVQAVAWFIPAAKAADSQNPMTSR